jgi:hypothetical protein
MSFDDDVRVVKESLTRDIERGRDALGEAPLGTKKVPKKDLLAEYQVLRENPMAWELKIMERSARLQKRGYKRADQMAELQVAQYAVEMEKLLAKGVV